MVIVAFRDIDSPDPLRNFNPDGGGYAYLWSLDSPPEVGSWAVVNGTDGPATVVVGHVGPNQWVRKSGTASLERITRLPSREQLKKATEASTALDRWLEHCRHVAGLKGTVDLPKLPPGFGVPVLPDASSTSDEAAENGGVWWRAYKKSEEAGHPQDEINRFKSLAQEWYRVRDQAP